MVLPMRFAGVYPAVKPQQKWPAEAQNRR